MGHQLEDYGLGVGTAFFIGIDENLLGFGFDWAFAVGDTEFENVGDGRIACLVAFAQVELVNLEGLFAALGIIVLEK